MFTLMLLHYQQQQQQQHVLGASGVVPFMLEPETYYGIIFASTCLFPIYQEASAPTVTSAVVLRRFRFYIWDSVDILLYVSPIGSVADPDTKDPPNFRSKTSFVI